MTEDVILYTLSTCPWCRKSKAYLNERNIPFDNIEYDLADEETKEMIRNVIEESGEKLAFPFLKKGDQCICGYNPKKYAEILGR
ncbi:glutaredoxin [Methanohalophilus levihalophilus]|nr:glutaredoxin [Methanohalophilus levihalophilus]